MLAVNLGGAVVPTALSAYLLVTQPIRPLAMAYVAGSHGTLIGADLLNLRHIRTMGAPVASIGGAGTLDGIFLTGLVSVLLA